MDLMKNLPSLPKKKKLKRIDIQVLKVCGTPDQPRLGNSRPCWNCICSLFILSRKKGYRIGKIYYSNEHGGISKSTLTKLLFETPYISRGNR